MAQYTPYFEAVTTTPKEREEYWLRQKIKNKPRPVIPASQTGKVYHIPAGIELPEAQAVLSCIKKGDYYTIPAIDMIMFSESDSIYNKLAERFRNDINRIAAANGKKAIYILPMNRVYFVKK